MALGKLPSGKWRGVVGHNGAIAATKAVATRAEASMLEARLKLEMGATPATDTVPVAELLRLQLEPGDYSPTTAEDLERSGGR